jgi:glycosyltransferase involved in cell wall biosynthesis
MRSDTNKSAVAINGSFLTQPATGVQRYAYEILRAWDGMLERGEIDQARYQIEIVAPQLNKPVYGFKHIAIRQVGFMSGNLWEQIELPWHTRGKFLFNPCNIGPIIKFNQAVTIHDASVYAVPWSYSIPFRLKYRIAYYILARTAKIVFTVSEFSKQELQKYCHIPEAKMCVTYEGCDHIERIVPDPSIFQRKQIGGKPYLLAVGSNAPHKNLSILSEVAKKLDADINIIIAGEENMHWFTKNSTDAKTGNLRRLGFVSDEE